MSILQPDTSLRRPATATPLGASEVAGLVIEALQGILGQLPTAEQTALVMAQIWLENGRGRAFIQYNWGNHSTYPNKNVPYWRPSWYEVTEASSARLRALHEKMLAGEAPQAFRAFDSHAQGLAHHFRTFQPGQRYHPLLTAAATGDPLAFAQAIWDTRYTRDYAPAVAAKSYGTLAKELLQKGLFDSLPKAEPASSLSAAVPDCSSLSDSDSEVGLSLGTYETALRAELHVLRRGSHGSLVALWQRLVAVEPDGEFGPRTEAVTRIWQRARGLVDDGVVGPLTWGKVGT